MPEYKPSFLKDEISINKLYSVRYFEYDTEFKFVGEAHPFWEMVYIDKGEAQITAGEKVFTLSQGEAYFHKPGEWHNIVSNKTAPSVVIISFECKSGAMSFFFDRKLNVGQKQKELISKITSEFTNCFDTPLNMVFCYKLSRRKPHVCGAPQLIKNYICELIISFLRSNPSNKQYSTISENNRGALLNVMLNYMHAHIDRKITMAELEKCSSLNKTTINNLFNRTFSTSPLDYFLHMKTDRAKQLLREDNYNGSQISEILGYSSIHYFSRQFKRFTGMSPNEYSRSIKALMQNGSINILP